MCNVYLMIKTLRMNNQFCYGRGCDGTYWLGVFDQRRRILVRGHDNCAYGKKYKTGGTFMVMTMANFMLNL